MKSIITAAAALLVLTTPALAATAPPRDRAIIRQFVDRYGECHYGHSVDVEACATDPDVNAQNVKPLQKRAQPKLGEKLEARGYWIVAKGTSARLAD